MLTHFKTLKERNDEAVKAWSLNDSLAISNSSASSLSYSNLENNLTILGNRNHLKEQSRRKADSASSLEKPDINDFIDTRVGAYRPRLLPNQMIQNPPVDLTGGLTNLG